LVSFCSLFGLPLVFNPDVGGSALVGLLSKLAIMAESCIGFAASAYRASAGQTLHPVLDTFLHPLCRQARLVAG
jgi:hypothetical protein